MTWFARQPRNLLHYCPGLLLMLLAPTLARADFTVEVDSEGVLEGAVVTARALDGQADPAAVPERVSMVQINRQFDPFILPVPVNVPVEFPNRDSTAHHVYSFSPVGAFELPLYKGDPPRPITFSQPGVVPLGCNIHDWMIGYIYVVDSPYYTQLRGNVGRFEDLPAGRYEIGIWHPALAGQQLPAWEVNVSAPAARQVLSLDYPFVAVVQPSAPIERFDEHADY